MPALPAAGLPSVETVFTFMRDAESRFASLRMRIEERAGTSAGDRAITIDVALRHPGRAKVSRSEPGQGAAASVETWISDGKTVRTFASSHRLGTIRPVRRRLVGLDDPDLPGFSQVYVPITPLPAETLPDTFVHPGNFCQNVLATGACRVVGTDEVAGRAAIVLVCDHPRASELAGERPDHRIEIAVDRDTGLIARLVETIGDRPTRHAEVVLLEPDGPLAPSALEFTFPADTTFIY